jgi:phage-related protein
MAKDSRALTLKLLADIDNFTKNINKADNEVTGFGDKVKKFGKIAGVAFAAAGVAAALYAGKLLKDGVEAAIADEKANAQLATTLRNVAGATDETIEKTLAYTRATELATGVTEDELRPSLNRLTIATGNVDKAMKLQTLALNVAAGSGKSLEAVTQALAKAQEGNTASLGRLGVGLTAAQLKTMSMDEVTKSLAETFAGAADTAANTFEGKMTRLGLAFEDVRDTVGGFVLDAITPMVENIVTKVMPALATFADGLTGGRGLKDAFTQITEVAKSVLIPIFQGLQSVFNKVKDAVVQNEEAFAALWSFTKNILAPFLGGAFKIAFEVIGTVIGTTITAVGKLISAFQTLFSWGNKVAQFLGFSGSSNISMTAPTPFSSGSALPPILPTTKGSLISQPTVTNNITVTGAIDSESAARQIVQVLNQSSYRGTLGAGALVAV